MIKKTLIIAGLLSVMSVGAQAANTILTSDQIINEAITNTKTIDSGNGGAILNNGYNLTVNANIKDNILETTTQNAVFGGGIWQSGGTLTINNGVIFDGNTVRSYTQTYPGYPGYEDYPAGGAIYLTGNAILDAKGKVTFNGNSVVNLDGKNSYGGAIFLQTVNKAEFQDVVFNQNSASTGGAIYNGDTTVTINGKGEFTGNTADNGGAIYSYGYFDDIPTITNTGSNSAFTSNRAENNGGAVVNYDGTINIGPNNNFSGNSAGNNGGAIYNSNYVKTSYTNIYGGTSFTQNSANSDGGAIYNSGNVTLDTTDGNITFSDNTAANGSDLYLAGENSILIVNGTNANNKVSFGSEKSIAGNGNIRHNSNGTFELLNNNDLSGFTGNYTQTQGKTLLDNSTMFDKFDITTGEFELLNNSTAVIDGINKKFNGSALTIDNSTLSVQSAINENVKITNKGQINLSKSGSLVLNSDDVWEGTITTTNGTSLTLDTFKGADGTYIQNGGSLSLINNSDLTLANADTSITGGTVSVGNGNTLTISNGAEIGGTTNSTVEGTLNIHNDGIVSGGTTTVKNGGNLNVSGDITGNANTTIQTGGKVTVDGGSIDSTGKTDIQAGSNLEITNGGNVKLHNGDNWKGTVTNNESTLTLDNLAHTADNTSGNYIQTNGTLNLTNGSNLTIGNGSSITNGDINVTSSTLSVGSGGNVSGGNININNSNFNINNGGVVSDGEITIENGSSFNVADGGQISGGHITFSGNNAIGLDGEVLAGAIFDVTNGNTVNITSNGSLTINSNDTWSDGTIKLSGGILNFEGIKNDTNGTLQGNSGNLTISSDLTNLIIGEGSYINDKVNVTVNKGSTLETNGGITTLDSQDKLDGNITVSDGELVLNNANKAEISVLTQNGGKTTVTGTFELNNDNDVFNDGELIINGQLNQTTGTIAKETDITINNSLNMTGGKTTIDGNDIWGGTVNLSLGELTLDNVTQNGVLIASGGDLKTTNNSTLTLNAGDIIEKAVNVDFDSSSEITINGGKAEFDGTEWKGSITLDKGTLNYSGTSNGTLSANAGNLNTEKGSSLTVNTGSYIKDEVTANIQGNLSVTGKDAVVNLGSGDTITGNINIDSFGTLNMGDNVQMADSGQTITFNGSNAVMNLIGNNNLDLKADITGSSGDINKQGYGNVIFSGETGSYKGNLTINNSGDLTFTDENGFGGSLIFGDIEGKQIGIIADKIIGTTTLDRDADITYSTYRDVDLVIGNTVEVTKGSITAAARPGQNVTFDNNAIASESGAIKASGQNVTFGYGAEAKNGGTVDITAVEQAVMNNVKADNATVITTANSTEFKNLDLTNSDLFINKNGFVAENLNIDGNSTIHVMNGTIASSSTGNINFNDDSTANFTIDISARDWNSDKFLIAGISENGTLNVSDFQFINKCPIDRNIALKIFETPEQNITFSATDKEIFTPIGYYKLFSQGGGDYTSTLVKYNPQVFRGQVATVANFQNQLVVNNLLFDHSQEINMQYLAEKNGNKYAAAYPQFAPYQYNKKDGSIWFKSFGTFERLGMTQGLNVNNNFYGTLIGADFPALELKKGWTMLPTAYIGYLGAHQTFANMGMYQNGGQLGAMATFMKNDFLGSVLAYGGGYGNEMNVAGYTDKTGNWYAGTAAKAAYNFHPSKHFTIQPTLLASYNIFGEQRWHTDFGDMSMRSRMLNGVNVAPGINFIYGRENWSVYATVQYFYNILGYSQGRAGNVELEGIKMRHGFLEYGIGFTRSWKERFSGYIQFVIRNGGRTGVGFQGGLMYRL